MRSSFFLLALASLAVPACSGGDDDNEPVNCVKLTEDDEFVIGLTKTGDGGKYDFKLTNFSPAPPARLLNEWTISITSTAAGAAPLAATETLYMTPYMPKHGHGAGVDVEIEPMPTAGEFKFTTINLHMPGLWEVTVEVEDPGAPGYETVTFKPCIPN
jgi:hypothetical protein